MTLGTCGGAVIPGVALMAIGIDQILTGASNIANPGVQSMSVFQFAGYSVAKSAGLSEGTSQVIGELTPMIASLVAGSIRGFFGCFAAGTPFRTPEGSVSIEEIKPGDVVLSRSEFDPSGPVEARVVEVFVRTAPVLDLLVGGRTITTTGEHPFFAEGRGWVPARELECADEVLGLDGEWLPIEEVENSGRVTTVYNFRVADWHTYFVGEQCWGFCVWSHNSNYSQAIKADLLEQQGMGVLRSNSPIIAGQLGREGEAASGIIKNTRQIDSISGTAAYRVPDELTATSLTEVKNVASLNFNPQIRDALYYAIENNLEFNLVVRQTTNLAPDLVAASKGGWINLTYLPW